MNPREPSNNLNQRRSNERNNNNDYHVRFNLNQYYNAVEDEQIYMDEYTSLLHRYNDFIVSGNAMFNRMEQTLRENISRTHVRQSFYFHRSDELARGREPARPQRQPPAPLNSMAGVAPQVHPAPVRPEQPSRPHDNTSPQPQIPSVNRLGEVFPRLLSRYINGELNRESREINDARENLFSMLYTVPIAVRTNAGAAGAAGGGGGAPTNDQINHATLNTVFSHIISPVNATCPISHDEFIDESEITMIRGCNHIFNRESLRRWLASNSTCPMCRRDIREYRAPHPQQQQQPIISQSPQPNISIDRVDDDQITFSYDIPIQYNNDQIYRDIVNTISGMAQTSQQNNDDNDDDIMEVD
jgi:hypothetical protein